MLLFFLINIGVTTISYSIYVEVDSLKPLNSLIKRKKFNVEGLKSCLMQQKEAGKAIVLLNFPNNPTGFTPSR